MIVKMGEKEVDFAKAFPLVLGDMMSLEELGIIDEKFQMDAASPVKIGKLLLHLSQKVDETTTIDDIKKIALDKFDAIGKFVAKKMAETEARRPT